MWQQWGGGHEEQMLKAAIKQYEKLHPNISITETPVTNDAKVVAAITGGNPPDIVDLGTSGALGGWASDGAIEPLNAMIKSSHLNLNQYVKAGLSAVTVKGQIYALPFMNFDVGLLYNKKLFAAAGLNPNKPPTTMAQLDADAAKLTKVTKKGISQLGFVPNYPGPAQGQECPLMTYGWLYGGTWYSPSGKPTPATPADIKALSWEKSFYAKYGAQKVANFVSSAGAYLTSGDPFESGKVAMVLDGPWALQYIKANVPSMAKYIGVAPFPGSTTATRGTTFVDTNAQFIPRGSQHAKQAFAFIKWETTNASLTAKFANDVANLPQLKSVPHFGLESDPRFTLFEKEAAAKTAHTWTQSKTSSQYSTMLCQAQDSALVGGSSPRAALTQLSSSIGA
jgi:multiple sugar transport system substrate-binding protein